MRLVATLIGLGACAVALAGCQVKNLAEQEVVVVFSPSATQAQHAAVRSACSHIPNVLPEPMPTSGLDSSVQSNVRFRVDKASLVQLNDLVNCLTGRPGVIGIDMPQADQ